MKDLSDIFEIQKTCEYKGEVYHVRDNGYVFRLRKSNKRERPLDEVWTIGKVNKQRGYLYYSSEVVHRIVATAFHKQPTKNHNIVDHIDTNRQNNRPENLRWVTRLDNILLNPISLSRVILMYGSIDNFLQNPSKPINGNIEQNFEWMRTVTKEESENARKNLQNWAKKGKISKGGKLSDWVYTDLTPKNAMKNTILQRKPKNPRVPKILSNNPIQSYYDNLKRGDILYQDNDWIDFVLEKEMINGNIMRVKTVGDSGTHTRIFHYEIHYNGRFFNHRNGYASYPERTEEYQDILDSFNK